MIQITDLEKYYRTDEVQTIALNKLSFEVKEGEFVAIMGPSGCGKSTLLNIVGMLDDPDSGSFIFNGEEVSHYNEKKRSELRKHNIGFSPVCLSILSLLQRSFSFCVKLQF